MVNQITVRQFENKTFFFNTHLNTEKLIKM